MNLFLRNSEYTNHFSCCGILNVRISVIPSTPQSSCKFFFIIIIILKHSRKYLPFDTKPCTVLVRHSALIFWESQPTAYSPAIVTGVVFLTFSLKWFNATLK